MSVDRASRPCSRVHAAGVTESPAMSKVRVHNFAVSLGGYAAGGGQRRKAPFGDGQERFGPWFAKVHIWRGDPSWPGGVGSIEEAIAATWELGIGAEIMG